MAETNPSPFEAAAAALAAVGGVPLIGRAISFLLGRSDRRHRDREEDLARREGELDQRERELDGELEARLRELEARDRRRGAEADQRQEQLDRSRLAAELLMADLAAVAPASSALMHARALMKTGPNLDGTGSVDAAAPEGGHAT